jgi:hypothetical protein
MRSQMRRVCEETPLGSVKKLPLMLDVQMSDHPLNRRLCGDFG